MFLSRLFDLSLKHKLPLWGSLLIVSTALAVSVGYLYRDISRLKQTMIVRSEICMRAVVGNLESTLMQGDIAATAKAIGLPFGSAEQKDYCQVQQFLVIDPEHRVIATSGYGTLSEGSKLDDLRGEYGTLATHLDRRGAASSLQAEIMEGPHSLLALPIISGNRMTGWLVAVHPENFYQPSIIALVRQTALITLLVLAAVLPLSWYWGRRMARPLTLLAKHMQLIGQSRPVRISPDLYAYGDELGQLFKAYDQMCSELEEKEAMKQEMLQTERLAALGRLAAGIAHEINNPLGGLITAVDTLKQHASRDQLVDRTLPILDRGLGQIREIVSALLVETRAKSHPLTHDDIADVRALLTREAEKLDVNWQWDVAMQDDTNLPSTLIRQILINLLLNAIQAAGKNGQVGVTVKQTRGHLFIEVVNDGKEIPAEVSKRLFEPFNGTHEGGHGLGLWVTYQIVQELRGEIRVKGHDGHTYFIVALPVGGA